MTGRAKGEIVFKFAVTESAAAYSSMLDE